MRESIHSNDKTVVAIIILIFLLRQLPTLGFDIFPHDEALNMISARDIADGKMLYTETWWAYGPIGGYLYGLVFKLFNVELMTMRIAFTLLYVPALVILYLLCRRLFDPFWSAVTALASNFMIFQPVYEYTHVFFVIGSMGAFLFLFKHIETHRYRWIVLSGVFTSVSLLHKPFPIGFTTAFAIIGSIAAYRIMLRKEPFDRFFKEISVYCLTLCAIAGSVYACMFLIIPFETLKNSLLFAFFRETFHYYMFSFNKSQSITVYIGHVFTADSLFGLYIALKNLYYSSMYYSPIIAFIASVVYAARKKITRESYYLLCMGLFAPLFMLQYLIHDTRPSREIGFVLYPVIIVLMFFTEKMFRSLQNTDYPSSIRLVLRYGLIAGLTLFFTAPSFYLLRTDLYAYTLDIDGYHGIRVNRQMHDVIEGTVAFVQERVPIHEPVAIFGNEADILHCTFENPMLFSENFYTTRNMFKYNNADQRKVYTRSLIMPVLEQERPGAIIQGRKEFPGGLLKDYITSNYTLAHQEGTFLEQVGQEANFHDVYGHKVYLRNDLVRK